MGDIVEFRPKQPVETPAKSATDVFSCMTCKSLQFELWVDGSVFCAGCHGWCHTLVIASKDVAP